MTVVEVELPEERSRRCERVLVPLEEIHGLWEHNPCLLLVKALP